MNTRMKCSRDLSIIKSIINCYYYDNNCITIILILVVIVIITNQYHITIISNICLAVCVGQTVSFGFGVCEDIEELDLPTDADEDADYYYQPLPAPDHDSFDYLSPGPDMDDMEPGPDMD